MDDLTRTVLAIMAPMAHDIKIAVAIIAAAVTKWLLTEELPPPDETALQRRRRIRRSVGGIIIGMLLGYYGNGTVIRMFSVLTPEDDLLVAVLLVITGEHIYRAALANAGSLLERITGGRGK